MPDTNLEKLKSLLAELFMLDQADLDFGIYRVMNAKRAEVTRFLDHDLLPQVRTELEKLQTGDRAGLETELAKATQNALALGLSSAEAERVEKVKNLRAKLAATVNVSALENEVLSDLANFFRRYYSEGDFLALRRYKAGVYAIPYEGEEVKLHWANADQYYIKTSEFLRDYTFKLTDGKRVHFKLVQADTEADNKKAAAGQERRFILCADDPLLEADGELVIRFEYRPDTDKRKQADLNTLARETILSVPGLTAWKSALARLSTTEKNPNRTLLEKHLGDYTARNSFDYFIHKDIGGFLRRELDFYIKNEIMHLDDIEEQDAPRVDQYLAKIKAIRKISGKIIDFLEQLENFQKKIRLKKKFVVETNYCATLDRVAESLYPEIAANDAQRAEWVKLFAIDEIQADLATRGYSVPLTVEFLKANPFLVLDTKLFSAAFKEKLLAETRILGSAATLDAAFDGLLIQSENFNALSLLQARYREQVKCVYIDPPYNTGDDGFPYKDNYRSSSWMAMMQDRLRLARELTASNGLLFLQLGDDESARSRLVAEDIFSIRKNTAVVRRGVKNVQAQFDDIDKLSLGHDVIHIMSKSSTTRLPHLYQALGETKPGKWDTFWRGTDRGTMRYPLFGQDPPTGQWRWEEQRAKRAVTNYERYLKSEAQTKTLDEWYAENFQAGVDLDFVRCNEDQVVQYYVAPQSFRLVSDNWLDVSSSGSITDFPHEKSIELLQRVIGWNTKEGEVVLDYFGGSGSTGHACFAESFATHRRKYILVEMGDYFETLLKPRLQRVIYSNDWKDGKPPSREGSSHLFKYIRLESYEDALNNLELRRTEAQDDLLRQHQPLREDYLLRYQLDVESAGSASLLNVAAFAKPMPAHRLNSV